MARRKDLAGIAALAGLGMLIANKGKKGVDEDSRKRQMAADRDASDQKTSGDQEDMFIEPGSGPHGQKFDDELPSASAPTVKKPPIKPGATATPAPKPVATGFKKNPGAVSPSPGNQRGPTAEELASYNAIRRKNPGTGNQRGPTAEELEAYAANRSRPEAKPSLDIPNMQQRAQKALADDPSALAGPAVGLGAAGYRAYKYGKSAYDAAKAAKAAERTAAAGRESVTNPLSWMAGPKNAGKFSGEVPAAGRESVTNPMSWMAGPKNAGKFKEEAPSAMDKAKAAAEKFADRFRKKPLDEADTTGGAIGYKRGGKVRGYASGGSVSSASSRGDGIASRGKTRGKIC
jgi:hypothetical protein